MVDITTIRNAQKEIRKLLHAIEQSPNTIVITDTKGIIEYINPHFTELTGYTKEETIGNNPNILKSGKMTENNSSKTNSCRLVLKNLRVFF